MIREYAIESIEKVVFGAGSLERVPFELARLERSRAFVVTGQSLAAHSGLAARLERLLGNRWVGTFAGSRQHVPAGSVDDAATAAEGVRADAVVTLGGGSVIDTGKLVALRLLGDRSQEAVPQIAIPTTLSAAEFASAAGFTDELTRVKDVAVDPRIVPRVVVLDPDVTMQTPSWLWGSTGIKALDHALEAVWSSQAQPVTDALALRAAAGLHRDLLPSMELVDREARGRCQVWAWMAISGLANTGVGLSHLLGHQIGARWDVPHGVTSCITLLPVMRFLTPARADRQALLAGPLGVDSQGRSAVEAASEAASALDGFLGNFDVPRRLRDVGADRSELPEVAATVGGELAAWCPPEDQLSEREVLGLLEQMW